MSKLYRYKHLPSGLYYRPCTHVRVATGYCKTNLSKKGKLYTVKYDPAKLIETYYNHLVSHEDKLSDFFPQDWEVEVLELKEDKDK